MYGYFLLFLGSLGVLFLLSWGLLSLGFLAGAAVGCCLALGACAVAFGAVCTGIAFFIITFFSLSCNTSSAIAG